MNNHIKRKTHIETITSLSRISQPCSHYFSLPYIPHLSYKLTHSLKKLNIQITYQVNSNLNSLLRTTMDRIDKLEKSGVYKLNCSCGRFYIGRTLRNVNTRISEHLKPIKKKNSSNQVPASNSAFAQNIFESQHPIDINNPDTEVLHFNNRFDTINNLEALEIMVHAKHRPDELLNDVINFDQTFLLKKLVHSDFMNRNFL